ncbi:MAG: LPS-assembly protein LptD, partial [Bacteroidia bacterium]|nr:LPS-assembly protein LptD [Bacteroidia bacterium]
LYNYKIPWNVRLAYSTTYSNSRRENEISSHSLMFSSNIELSPRWSVGLSSGWDLKNKGVTPTQLRLERDLLSWRMNFSYNIPSGQARNNTTWYFFIGIKSGVLSDIKYDQRRQPDRQL